jgi:odorant receptor
LDVAENINKLYAPIIFGQFLITSLQLCVLGFQFVMFKSIMKKVVAGFYFIAMVIQLFVYTYGGQLVMDRSISVADKLYQTDNDLIIIIARSQKTSIIKSGFYEASSTTFSTILSSAASLITVLKSLMD